MTDSANRCLMHKLWLHCLLIIFVVTLSVYAQTDTVSDTQLPATVDQEAQELLLKKANHLFDEGDFAKALIYYNQLVVKYPDAPAAVTAKSSIEQILQSLATRIAPQLLYQKIIDSLKTKPTYQTIERACEFMYMFPDRKQFSVIQSLLLSVFESVCMRYMVTSIEPPDSKLIYVGTVIDDGTTLHRFEYDNSTCDVPMGGRIMFYQVTDYDSIRGVELTSLENMPYRLKEKYDEQQYHYFSTQLVHFPLRTVCTAHLFLDNLFTRRGYEVYGEIDTSAIGRVTVTVPAGESVKQIAFEDDAIADHTTGSIQNAQGIMEKSYAECTTDSGNDQLLAKFRYFIQAKQWLEALGFYLWLIQQAVIDSTSDTYMQLYQNMEQHITNTTLPDRLLEYAHTCFKRDYLISAITEFTAIIDGYPADRASMEAHNFLVQLAHRPQFVLGVGNMEPVEFPLTFMGFNIVGESQYMNQINYKKRTYFVGRDESIGGFRVTNNETRTISYFDQSLNVTKEQQVHYLNVVPDQSETIWLQEGESYADPSRWYIEITDRTNGKTYPAYINKDQLVTTDGTQYTGLIVLSANQQEVSVYADLMADSQPVVVKKQHIHSLHMENYSDEKLFERLFTTIGPVAIAEIRNYYQAQKVSPERIEHQDAPSPLIDNDAAAVPDIDRSGAETDTQKDLKKTVDKPKPASSSKKSVSKKQPAKDKKDQTQNVSAENRNEQKDEIVIRRKKLQLKKRIIKVLGVCIVLWLLYMAYKLIKSFR